MRIKSNNTSSIAANQRVNKLLTKGIKCRCEVSYWPPKCLGKTPVKPSKLFISIVILLVKSPTLDTK